MSQITGLPSRGLRPVSELGARRDHGDRLRYMAGCRCTDCRQANTQYERSRADARKAGDWNGIVPADKARAHMAALSAQGVGRRSVGDVSGVGDTILSEIIAGRKTRIRARTERAILAVTPQAAADGALVDAAPTWLLLDELIADGYTKTELARALGSTAATPALQIQRTQCTVRHAFDVQKLHAQLRLIDAGDTLRLLADLSEEGFHRDRVIRMLADLAAQRGTGAPDLVVRKGRIRITTARIVAELHEQLTE